MSLYNLLDRHLFLPLGDLVYGSCVSAKLRELERNDRLSADELSHIQNEKLQRLVRHCYETVPYYQRLFKKLGLTPKDIQSPADLPKLPILTKQIIRDNYQDFFSTAVDSKRRKSSSTGGSTGTPLQFCTDAAEWSVWKASTLRAWGWYGIHVGDKIFSLGGNSINQKKGVFSFKGMYDRVIMRNFKHSSADVSDECMQKHYESFRKLKPKVIRGYGSSLYIFARYIEKNRLPVCPIKAVLTTGEVLIPEYRRKLGEVFHAPVYDAYGAGDGGILSHECPKHEGLHITEESCIIEITDKQGTPLPRGETGYVCSTDLDNYAFPFLRYHVGDMAYLKTEFCSCGRSTHLIGEVAGRAGRLIYSKEGVPISPLMLWIMMYPKLNYHKPEHQEIYNKIDRFQIRQDRKGDIAVLLKLKDKKDETNQFDYISENFKKHFGDANVTLSFVGEIPSLPSGKEDYCVSDYRP